MFLNWKWFSKNSKIIKIPHFSWLLTLDLYIYDGVALDAFVLDMKTLSWAATPSHADLSPKFARRTFLVNLQRGLPAISGVPCGNRHRGEVDLVILYTGAPFVWWIYHSFIVSLTHIPLFRWGSRLPAIFLHRFRPLLNSSRHRTSSGQPHPSSARRRPWPVALCCPVPRPCSRACRHGCRRPVCMRACSGQQPPAKPAPVQRAAAVGLSATAAPLAGWQAKAEPPSLPCTAAADSHVCTYVNER